MQIIILFCVKWNRKKCEKRVEKTKDKCQIYIHIQIEQNVVAKLYWSLQDYEFKDLPKNN